MKRPTLFILLFLIFGILLGQYAPYGVSIVFFIFFIIIFSFLLYKIYKLDFVILMPIFSILGVILLKNSLYCVDKNIEKVINKDINIYGIVNERIESSNSIILYIKAEYFKYQNKSIQCDSNIYVILDDNKDAKIGEAVIIKGKISKLQNSRHFGDYDELKYLKTRGIDYKMFADSIKNGKIKYSFNFYIKAIRDKLANIYDSVLPEKEAGILKAIILGNKSGLDDYVKQLYQNAGIYHIIAISGLHISIIAAILMYITSFLNKSDSSILIIIALWIYCFLTGCNVSTIRAAIMTSIVLFGYVIGKEADFINSIAFSCLVLLLYQPLYLFDISFQYSFAAVTGIALIYPQINKIINLKLMKELFACSIAVALSTKAISAFYFYKINTTDIFVNMLILPSVFLLVISGIFCGLSGLISINLAKLFGIFICLILKVYEYICLFFSSFSFSNVITGKINIIFIFIYYIVLILFVYIISTENNKKFLYLKKLFLILLSLFLTISLIYKCIFKSIEIQMLDVGQGDCIVVKEDKNCIVIDGGGSYNTDFRNDTSMNVLLPNMRYNGIKNINAVFVTHTDEDHIKGIIEIIGQINIGKIFLPCKDFDDDCYKMLVFKSNKYGVPIYKIKNGDEIKIGKDIAIDCISPYCDMNMDNNNSSIVIKLKYKNISALFTGDIEKEAEKYIIEKNNDIKADILKLSHHGSKTSTTDEFIDNVNPKFCIVSAGNYNIYKHPSKETVSRLEKRNIKIFNTNQCGDIFIKSNGSKIKVITKIGG